MSNSVMSLIKTLIVFIVGFCSAYILLRPEQKNFPPFSKDQIREFVQKTCNSSISDDDISKIKEGIGNQTPHSIKIDVLIDGCSFYYEDTIGRSDILGFGAAVIVGNKKVFLLYNFFGQGSEEKMKPSMILAPEGIDRLLFL